MKQKTLLTIFGLAFLAFVFSSNSGGRASSGGAGNTGAPGETGTCASCHSGGSFGSSLSVQVFNAGTTTPVTNYMPGTTYDLKVTVTNSSGSPAGYGFQMVALKNSTNTSTGTWTTPGSNTKIATAGTRSYVEHGVGGTYSTSNIFTTKWVAPASGTGNVTFYSAGNVVNGNGGTSGDSPTSSVSVTLSEFIGNVSASTASNVALADVNNAGNGSDVQISFNKGTNESTISQYRVMIVKQANAASFNLAAANAVATGSYTVIFPNGGSTYSQTLGFLAKDVNGALIANGQSYVAFVLSVADGTTANTNAISSASNTINLQGVAGTATALALSDIGTIGAPDVSVSFNKATTESTVAAYRVMLVDNANASAFNLTAAQAVPNNRYINVTPNGSNTYTETFDASITDVMGNPLANGMTYKAFVLSIADGTNAVGNTLSSGSNALQLQTVAAAATNVTALDTNETATGEDVLVYFDAASDETTISTYRILMVKEANASGFNLAAANAVTMSNYTSVTPNLSTSYSTTLSTSATDVDGNAIAINVPYKAFVLSVANGTTAGTSALSSPSATLILNDPVSTEFQQNLVANMTMIGEQLYVRIDGKYLNENLQLMIFDANGRQIINNQNLNQSENWIDMSAFSRGVYWVTIRSGNQLWKSSVLR